MKLHISIVLLLCLFIQGCSENSNRSEVNASQKQIGGELAKTESVNIEKSDVVPTSQKNTDPDPINLSKNEPKTLREFFSILPEKYFNLEGCDRKSDGNCDKARAEYIKNFLEIEDAKNGYWKSGCDGAQSCLTMALFKRPDSNYLVHILTEFESGEESYFLDYKNGNWSDIGSKIVPEYSSKNIYVPPRMGTKVDVYQKDTTEPHYSQRGKKLYELLWKDGKFSIKK